MRCSRNRNRFAENGPASACRISWATHRGGRDWSFLGHDRLRFALFGVPEFDKVTLRCWWQGQSRSGLVSRHEVSGRGRGGRLVRVSRDCIRATVVAVWLPSVLVLVWCAWWLARMSWPWRRPAPGARAVGSRHSRGPRRGGRRGRRRRAGGWRHGHGWQARSAAGQW